MLLFYTAHLALDITEGASLILKYYFESQEEQNCDIPLWDVTCKS